MADKLPRVKQRVFGSSSSNNGVFGSARAGTKVLTNNIKELMSLPAWLQGWGSATISGDKLPTLEEMQGIQKVTTQQIAYVLQEGIPEWDSETDYFINSIVKSGSSAYIAIQDNINTNPASSPLFWESFGGGIAEKVAYDNSVSGLTATNVQDAIDEIQNEIETSTTAERSLFINSGIVQNSNNTFTLTDGPATSAGLKCYFGAGRQLPNQLSYNPTNKQVTVFVPYGVNEILFEWLKSATVNSTVPNAGSVAYSSLASGLIGTVTDIVNNVANKIPTVQAVKSYVDNSITALLTSIVKGISKSWVNMDATASANISGTYAQSGTTVTVTLAGHGHIVGHVVQSAPTSGTAVAGTYTITSVIDANTFTYTAGTSLTTTGNITFNRRLIRSNYNIHSVSYVSAGNYYINFSSLQNDANYVMSGSSSNASGVGAGILTYDYLVPQTIASVKVRNNNDAGGSFDPLTLSVIFHGN